MASLHPENLWRRQMSVRPGAGVERAMGIEPKRASLPELENKRFGANANAKRD